MATSTIQISQLTLATPVAADSVAGANAAGQARRYTVGSLGTAHTHAVSQVSGLQTALDGKASVASTNVLRVETLNGLNGVVTVEAGSGVTVATQGSKITISAATGGGGGAVSSVNGATGVVVLTSASVSAASAVHGHVVGDVTGLQSALDGKAALAATNVARVVSLNGLGDAVTIAAGSNVTVSTSGSTITIAAAAGGDVASVNGVTGAVVLTSASVSAASAVHSHVISDVTGLQTELDGKAALAATNVTRVVSLQGLTGTVTLTGVNLTVATAAGSITLTAPVGGGGGGGDVSSVNGLTGTVVLTSASVSAASAVHSHVPADITGFDDAVTNASIVRSLNGITGVVSISHTSVSAAAASHTHDAGDVVTGTFDVARLPTHTHTIANVDGLQAEIDGKASSTHAAQHQAGGADLVLPVVTSATLTASVNNYAPPTGDILRLSSETATAVVTGLAGGVGGFVRLLLNVSTNTVRLAHASSGSGATNRFVIAGGADLDLAEGESASAFYDADSQRWRVSGGAGGGGGSTETSGIVSINGYTATAVTLTADDVTAASASHMTTHRAGGSDELLPLVTAVSLTSSVNDYSLPAGDIFRLSNTSTTNTVEITGLATAVDGSSKLLINVSTGASSSYTIKHANTNSTAVSRFLVPWAGDYVLSPNGGAALVIYDDTDNRWRVV